MNKLYYTQKEVADIMGVTAVTVNRWVRDGKVNVIYLPMSTRPLITQEELDRLNTPVTEKPGV